MWFVVDWSVGSKMQKRKPVLLLSSSCSVQICHVYPTYIPCLDRLYFLAAMYQSLLAQLCMIDCARLQAQT